MGAEAPCRATVEGRAYTGKAWLETKEILFRGEGFRVVVPLSQIQRIEAHGGTLDVRWDGQHAQLELGPAADKWLKKIKNPPGLLDKLGVKPGMKVGIAGLADEPFLAELRGRGAEVGPARAGSDLIFVAVERKKDLDQLAKLAKNLAPAGALWVIRPKGKKEVTEADSMAAGKAAGLVDVKVAAFSATHTAEKYVIPLANRGSATSRR